MRLPVGIGLAMGKTKRNKQHSVARIFFVVYCAVMLWLLFGQRMNQQPSAKSINLIPLDTLKLYANLMQSNSGYLVRHAYVNLVGNVVMFIPFGIFLPQIWVKLRSFFKVLALTVLVVIAIEGLQYLTALGSCDVDDVILNVPGALFGYIFWSIFCQKKT